MSGRIEWDRQEADANIRNHRGVPIDEATTVFDDPLAAIFGDASHSTDEDREIVIGHSTANRLLVVCFRASQGSHSYLWRAFGDAEGTQGS
ncbi:MAG: BrnT family toxin [Anaerolineae bacterium]